MYGAMVQRITGIRYPSEIGGRPLGVAPDSITECTTMMTKSFTPGLLSEPGVQVLRRAFRAHFAARSSTALLSCEKLAAAGS